MLRPKSQLTFVASAAVVFAVSSGQTGAAVFNESGLGDFSNSQGAPTSLSFSSGLNQVIGNVTGGSDTQDWITFNVPVGFAITSEVLAVYTSTDAQGFTGFHSGTTFAGSVNSPGSYNGYTHFGTGAQNASFPAVNLVGQDLLPIMANPSQDPGATGFTPPLGPGDYTFLFQQLGATTAYEFDFTVSPVPEPAALMFAPLAALVLAKRRLLPRV